MQYTSERLIVDDQNSDIYKEHIARYKFCLPFVKNKTVLDIACGSGYGAKLIADNQADNVFAGDISQTAIDLAIKRYSASNLIFKKMDACQISFEHNYFDIIISFETIEHIQDYKKFAQEIYRCLKPNGRLVLSTPNKQAVQKLGIKNKFHLKEFSQEELLKLLNNYFKNVELFGQRPISCTNRLQKLLKKLHLTINKIPFLGVLRDNLHLALRHKAGQRIDGLNNDFSIRKISKNQDYLYLIAVCEK
ncbi:MAG: class I SAM-dependent methyltransferase [Candidatus Kuenenbacteria bacterium]